METSTKVVITSVSVLGLAVAGYFTYEAIVTANLKKAALNLSTNPALNPGGDAKVVDAISKSDLAAQKVIVDNTPVIEIGDSIYNAKGTFWSNQSNYDKVLTALARIQSPAALAYLSDYFQLTYKISLLGYLQSWMDSVSLGSVNNLLNNLKSSGVDGVVEKVKVKKANFITGYPLELVHYQVK